MSVTAAQKSAMDTDVQRVRAAGAAALAVAMDAADGFFSDAAAGAVLTQVRAQLATLDKWAGQWRAWAEDGKDTTGAPAITNALEFWKRIGQDLVDFFTFAAKQAKYTLITTVLEDTVKTTAETVVSPSLWSPTVQLLLGGLAALVVAAVVYRVLR